MPLITLMKKGILGRLVSLIGDPARRIEPQFLPHENPSKLRKKTLRIFCSKRSGAFVPLSKANRTHNTNGTDRTVRYTSANTKCGHEGASSQLAKDWQKGKVQYLCYGLALVQENS